MEHKTDESPLNSARLMSLDLTTYLINNPTKNKKIRIKRMRNILKLYMKFLRSHILKNFKETHEERYNKSSEY